MGLTHPHLSNSLYLLGMGCLSPDRQSSECGNIEPYCTMNNRHRNSSGKLFIL